MQTTVELLVLGVSLVGALLHLVFHLPAALKDAVIADDHPKRRVIARANLYTAYFRLVAFVGFGLIALVKILDGSDWGPGAMAGTLGGLAIVAAMTVVAEYEREARRRLMQMDDVSDEDTDEVGTVTPIQEAPSAQ